MMGKMTKAQQKQERCRALSHELHKLSVNVFSKNTDRITDNELAFWAKAEELESEITSLSDAQTIFKFQNINIDRYWF